MLNVLLRRLFSAVPVLAIVSLITFGMIHMIPGDPAGDRSTGPAPETARFTA